MAKHKYLASFFNKNVFLISRTNGNYSKLISDSSTKSKGSVAMDTFPNFAYTFIYLEIFVRISPKRSSTLFVKYYSLTPKVSCSGMINKQKLIKYSLNEVKLFTHYALLVTHYSKLVTFYSLLVTVVDFSQRRMLKFP